jgi:hypothetical protein
MQLDVGLELGLERDAPDVHTGRRSDRDAHSTGECGNRHRLGYAVE